jgi:hypothetical protein
MVRATKIGSVVVGLAASGLAWGQSAQTPPAPVPEPTGKIITVNESGKPAQKCRLIKMWTQPSGGKACQVQAIDTGHIMTIVQSAPSAGGDGKTLPMTIYHWTGNMPHPQAPMPPITMETAPIQRSGAVTVVQHSEPMPVGTPAVTNPSNVSSAFMQPPMPPVQQQAPRPMTPGGTVLTPAPTVHGGSSAVVTGDCGTCNGCSSCKPSLLERLKGCLRRDSSTDSCSTGCTTCTTTTPVAMKTAAGETIVPVPSAPAPTPTTEPSPKQTVTVKTASGFFQRQRLAGDDMKEETPRADAKKPDPLKDPAAYSPAKTTAELAISGVPTSNVPKTVAVLPDSNVPKTVIVVPDSNVPKTVAGNRLPHMPRQPGNTRVSDMPRIVTTEPAHDMSNTVVGAPIALGAGSVLQAGDAQYVPVPIVTMPDVTRPMAPPVAQVPQAPQPNQAMMANAFATGTVPMPPATAGDMSGNAFGSNPNAAIMADGAFHQGMPNANGYSTPGFTPPGYGGLVYHRILPQAPMSPAVQPGIYSVPRGQMVAPAGYRMQEMPQAAQPMMQPAASQLDIQSLLNQLRDSMLPSQREWAALELAELDRRQYPGVVDALIQSAKDDPAASVRAGCIHGLARLNVDSPALFAALNSLCNDPDSRVRQEASEALAKRAPSKTPAMLADPAVQPAGVIIPRPSRSN